MKYLRKYESIDGVINSVVVTPFVGIIDGFEKPIFASLKIGENVKISLDDNGFIKVTPFVPGEEPDVEEDNTELESLLETLNGSTEGAETSYTNVEEIINNING